MTDAPAWTQVAVHAALANYAALIARARHVADVVYAVRYPRDHSTYFQIEFYDEAANAIGFEASYHYRSNSHSLHIPIEYLWEDDDESLRQREQERIDAERLAADRQRKMQEAAEEAARLEVERKTYDRLKKKFEGGADARSGQWAGGLESDRPSDAT